MKKIVVLLLAVFILAGCVGSPVTVQVVKDVNGDVSQEVGTIHQETSVATPTAVVENGASNRWLVLFLALGIPALFVVYILTHLFGSSSSEEYPTDNSENWSRDEWDQYAEYIHSLKESENGK